MGDRRANLLAVATLLPSWIVGLSGWASHDVGDVALGMLLALCARVLARFVPRVLGWPGSRDDQIELARNATRLAFVLGLLTFVVFAIWGISGACNGGYECPV